VHAATLLRRARQRAGLSLRGLAARADTSHSAVAAYEAGRKVPTVETLERLLRAAGFDAEVALTPRVGGDEAGDRGDELLAALELAALFPARHDTTWDVPVFGRA
jgi:transcriptional regulator with XRE-family HTH domain